MFLFPANARASAQGLAWSSVQPNYFFAAQGLQGDFFAAQGLQGAAAFFAAHGLHGAAVFFAAQGLQGEAAFFAAQGLQGEAAFLAAQGLQGLAALGLHGPQAARAAGTFAAATARGRATDAPSRVFVNLRIVFGSPLMDRLLEPHRVFATARAKVTVRAGCSNSPRQRFAYSF